MKALMLRIAADIAEITPRTEAVIYSFRPNMKNILDTIEKGRNVKTLFVPTSTMKSIGPAAMKLVDTMGMKLKTTPKDMRGTRTDIIGKEVEIQEEV